MLTFETFFYGNEEQAYLKFRVPKQRLSNSSSTRLRLQS